MERVVVPSRCVGLDDLQTALENRLCPANREHRPRGTRKRLRGTQPASRGRMGGHRVQSAHSGKSRRGESGSVLGAKRILLAGFLAIGLVACSSEGPKSSAPTSSSSPTSPPSTAPQTTPRSTGPATTAVTQSCTNAFKTYTAANSQGKGAPNDVIIAMLNACGSPAEMEQALKEIDPRITSGQIQTVMDAFKLYCKTLQGTPTAYCKTIGVAATPS
jgi:hypothetical protein